VSSSWRQLATRAVRVAVREAPRLLREPGARIRSSQGATRQPGPPVGPSAPATVRPPGAPVGRHLDYAPDLDGRADPGEVVWTWVAFEEDASQGKDRPVLVVGRDGDRLLGLMLSSQAYHQGDQDWCALGAGAWDGEHRPAGCDLTGSSTCPRTEFGAKERCWTVAGSTRSRPGCAASTAGARASALLAAPTTPVIMKVDPRKCRG
jgi:hypothetical protein